MFSFLHHHYFKNNVVWLIALDRCCKALWCVLTVHHMLSKAYKPYNDSYPTVCRYTWCHVWWQREILQFNFLYYNIQIILCKDREALLQHFKFSDYLHFYVWDQAGLTWWHTMNFFFLLSLCVGWTLSRLVLFGPFRIRKDGHSLFKNNKQSPS